MAIELTAAQHAVLEETRAIDTPEAFAALLQHAQPELGALVDEVMGPDQPVDATLIALRQLYRLLSQHADALTAVNYGATARESFRDAIRLVDTAQLWFLEGTRARNHRPLTVKEVVAASRPFRARLRAYAAQAFAYEPATRAVLSSKNRSGTIDEELSALRRLVGAAREHQARLVAVGATEAWIEEGEALLTQAGQRNLLGIVGIRRQDEAHHLRDALLTYAVLRGRHARAAGVNACFDQPALRRSFEEVSLRECLRRTRTRRPRPRKAKENVEAKRSDDAARGRLPAA
ncbi:hypothetical protein [Chondromyces crocatus]|uniref:Uncharacterized protein n=1 Tax=Chondromyces crocatus TaxID=52 RepID=A0A0K1E9E0_CHOCO|nr:hypothetical protein [Chondromyces crocatus]AKT37188.1 uncharacterized protein CMC5_013180 [Chondromyces crocatus]